MTLTPLWIASGRPFWYPSLRGTVHCDVAIVGGGITGLTAAYLLQREGRSVVLVDKAAILSGDTGRTTAHLTQLLDTPYQRLVSWLGANRAKQIADSKAAAIDQIEALVRDLGIDCHFRRLPGYLFAASSGDARTVEKEARALEKAGIPVSLPESMPLPIPTKRVLRCERQGELDPGRYCRAMAARFVDEGGRIFEDSPVSGVSDGNPCVVSGEEGEVRCRDVLIATHAPAFNRVFLQTKVAHYRTYVLGVRVPGVGELPGLFWDTASPYHYLRSAQDEAGPLVLVGGADHKTGEGPVDRDPFARLANYVHDHFGMSEIRWRWSGQIVEPVDGLPYIGRNPFSRHVYVATGFSGNGTTFGTLAARLVRDAILGRHNEWAELYESTRLVAPTRLTRFVRENAGFPYHFVADRLRTPRELEDLAPGEGAVVERDGRRVAAYRTPSGDLRLLSPVCTHLGCLVHWNRAEGTWDCPCHGSRFGTDGRVLNGPAVQGLAPADGEEVPTEEREEHRRAVARSVQTGR